MVESLPDLKQAIMKIYNCVNQEMYEIGVKQLRVDVVGNKIIILPNIDVYLVCGL